MKRIVLAFLVVSVACTSTGSDVATSHRRSPTPASQTPGSPPSSSPSPAQTASGPPTRPTHLNSGQEPGRLGLITIPTVSIRPDPHDTVLVFVAVLSVELQPVGAPSVTGGGAHWTQIEGTQKNSLSTRGLFAFAASNVRPGPLTIGLPTGTRATTCWSIVEARGSVLRTITNPAGALETSHSITMPDPTGLVVAAWAIGQEVPATVEPPFQELGQVHTVNPGATCLSAWGLADTATATWSQPGHSIAIAVELG
jgi:hypothetical protein